ncbi:hypothetical protein TWF718_000596 [Orbilia javanica]|uniref:Clr5 domain-containing protein n=1 Tax=Orbilia javanica TaxID=47235 RepID=A0AAN8NFN2_9PEZI
MDLVRMQFPCSMDLDRPAEPTAFVPAKRKRASPNKSMDEYKEEMKFYYLHQNYTLKEVRDAMESHYNLGASLVQYRERLNKWGFKKRGTRKQWETIAKSVAARGNEKESEAVINGHVIISFSKLKKEMTRKFTLSELTRMKNKAQLCSQIGSLSPMSETIEVRSPIASPISWPIFDSWYISAELLNSLPIRISDSEIIRICKNAFLSRWSIQPEEKIIIKSRSFKDLRLLLYRLSNKLLDFKILNEILDRLQAEDGYKALEELISLNTISVKAACSSLLLLFALRQEYWPLLFTHKRHPDAILALIQRLNKRYSDPKLKARRRGGIYFLEDLFLKGIRAGRFSPARNSSSINFLRCCLYDKFPPRPCLKGRFLSPGFRPEKPALNAKASMLETEETQVPPQFLHLDCGVNINIQILKALLFAEIEVARVLLHYITYTPPTQRINWEVGLTERYSVELEDWFWTELSPFLDTYLEPLHLCHLLCGLVFMGRGNLVGLLLQYIQKSRTIKEKRYMEKSIERIVGAGYWGNGYLKIYAARSPIRSLEKPIEDSLTIAIRDSKTNPSVSRDVEPLIRASRLRAF